VETGLLAALQDDFAALPVIDCHEHTYLPNARPRPVDLGCLLRNSDVGDDLISAGMPAGLRPRLDWESAAPYLPAVRNTGFYRSLQLACLALFDVDLDTLSAESWETLSGRIQAANAAPDWYAQVLQGRADIRRILRVQGDEADPYDVDRTFFAPLIKFDDWIMAGAPEERARLAEGAGGWSGSLAAFLQALDAAFETARQRGAAGAKSLLAYRRTLASAQPVADDIARLYNRADWTPAETVAFQDFMLHAVAERAGAFGFSYQMHVGYGSWQSNITAQANPLLLNALIEAHRQTKFVLLHGAYPFIGEVGTLAKNHPNVYIEAGWLAYIAPAAYRRAMAEWLDSVPANKIMAFGADCLHIEQTFGALLLTRRLLAQVLAGKVQDMDWDEGLARSVARGLLHDNAAELYGLA
jgi:uncharacterized protein